MKLLFEQFSAMPYTEARTQEDVNKDCAKAWKASPHTAMKFIVVVSKIDRNEAISRWLWLAMNQPQTFSANIHKLIYNLGYDGLIELMLKDIEVNGWENRTKELTVVAKAAVLAGLQNPRAINLVLNALPKIKQNNSNATGLGKYFAISFFGKTEIPDDYSSYTKYRKLLNGQTNLIQGERFNLNLDKCNRKVVALLAGINYSKEHNLTLPSYNEEFAGSVFDIFRPFGCKALPLSVSTEDLLRINSRWLTFMSNCKEVGKNNSTLVITDVSPSTEGPVVSMTSYYVGKCLALMYASLNVGYFHNKYYVFGKDECVMHTINADNACSMWAEHTDLIYSHNNTLDKVYKALTLNKDLDPAEYPSTILIISDGGFELPNKAYQEFMNKLPKEYAKRVKIVILNIPNGYQPVNSLDLSSIPEGISYVHNWDQQAMWSISSAKGSFKPSNTSKRASFYALMDQPDVMDTQVIFRSKPKIKLVKSK